MRNFPGIIVVRNQTYMEIFKSAFLSDCNWTRTRHHLVHKRTLNHLAKLASLAKWLSVRLWTKWLWARVPSCSHLNFRFCAYFEQGVPWHSGKYRVWVHSETRTWHDKNIQTVCICKFSKNVWSASLKILLNLHYKIIKK